MKTAGNTVSEIVPYAATGFTVSTVAVECVSAMSATVVAQSALLAVDFHS
jgi:ABC-type polysaccharide/polyol phosphate export permease